MDPKKRTDMVYTRLFLYLVVLPYASGTDYIQVNQNLAVMPTNIPADTVRLDLSDNQISSVDYISGVLSSLTDFTMQRNQLTEFPDLTNCSNVTVVNLESNFIAHIRPERLDMLTQLSALVLRSNLLKSFPDVPGPASTLTHINLNDNALDELPVLQYLGPTLNELFFSRNNIANVPKQFFEQVQPLTNFWIGTNQLTSFPYMSPGLTSVSVLGVGNNDIGSPPIGWFPRLTSLTLLKIINTGLQTVPMDICLRGNLDMNFDLNIKNNPLVCDQDMRWLRLAEEAGVRMAAGAVCAEPDTMSSRTWETVTWEDLTYHGGQRRQSNILDVTKTYSCASRTVSDVIADSTPLECATVCLARADCVMFAMGRVGGDLSVCAVTNGTRSDTDIREEYDRLYVIEQQSLMLK